MKLPVSICIIAKNSENEIEKCLFDLKNIFNEIILIDTGSVDKTPVIARMCGAKVYSHLWKYNFSEARNSAFEYITQPWNFWVDSDEIIMLRDKEKFSFYLSDTKYDSYFILRKEIFSEDEVGTTTRCRLLKTEKNYRFEGVIHETPNVNFNTTYNLDESIVYLEHYGYNINYKNPEEKSKRNIEILRKAQDYNILDSWEKINNSISLSLELNKKKDLDEKLELIEKIENAMKNFSNTEIRNNTISLNYFSTAIQTYNDLKNLKLEEKYCMKAFEIFPDALNILTIIGEFYYKLANYDKSLFYYQKIIELVENNLYLKGIYIHDGIRDYGTYYNIALCYKQKKMNPESIEYLLKSIQSNQNFSPAKELLFKLTGIYNKN